jgi:CheY-like chemotaxis protein
MAERRGANRFAFSGRLFHPAAMTKPLALVCYQNLLPGSKLPNRLTDLDYRVQTVADAGQLPEEARRAKPMLILLDLACKHADICSVIRQVRSAPETEHIPIVAFADAGHQELQAPARQAGANIVANDRALLAQLPHLLQQVLEVQ